MVIKYDKNYELNFVKFSLIMSDNFDKNVCNCGLQSTKKYSDSC